MQKSSWESAEEGPRSGIGTAGPGRSPVWGEVASRLLGAVGKPGGVVLSAMLVRGRTSRSPGEEAAPVWGRGHVTGRSHGAWPQMPGERGHIEAGGGWLGAPAARVRELVGQARAQAQTHVH